MLALAAACLVIAAWYAGDAAYIHAKAWLGQRLLLAAWNEAKSTGNTVKPWPWADTHPVARLSVPGHRIELLVLAGANGRTLAWGPGHVEGTAKPGTHGNTVVTAHRDTHFAFLRELVPGDLIVVETPGGSELRYRVERSLVADRRALRLPADDRSATLALVTCYPFDAVDPGTPLRYAVIARAEEHASPASFSRSLPPSALVGGRESSVFSLERRWVPAFAGTTTEGTPASTLP